MSTKHTACPAPSSSLLAAVQAGREGWDRLVKICTPPVYRWLRRQGLQDADAQDVLGEVLLSLSRNIGSYQPGRPFIRWLFAIARSRYYDSYRKRANRPGGVGGTDFLGVVHAQVDPASVEVDRDFRLDILREALEQLARKPIPRSGTSSAGWSSRRSPTTTWCRRWGSTNPSRTGLFSAFRNSSARCWRRASRLPAGASDCPEPIAPRRTSVTHPTTERLHAYLREQSTPEEKEHIDRCADCQAVLERLISGGRWAGCRPPPGRSALGAENRSASTDPDCARVGRSLRATADPPRSLQFTAAPGTWRHGACLPGPAYGTGNVLGYQIAPDWPCEHALVPSRKQGDGPTTSSESRADH